MKIGWSLLIQPIFLLASKMARKK